MKKFSDRIKSVFSHFQAKLLLAFLVCTLLPLGTIGFIFYRVTYEIAEDKIMSSALLADDQLNVQVNDRIRQTENVADSIQYDMYTLSQTDSSSTQSLSVFGSVRNDISMFKTTFGYYHISIFLPGSDRSRRGTLLFSSGGAGKFPHSPAKKAQSRNRFHLVLSSGYADTLHPVRKLYLPGCDRLLPYSARSGHQEHGICLHYPHRPL